MSSDEIDEHAVFESLQDTDKMNRLMDGLFGPGNWVFDATENVWIAPNSHGPGYVVVRRGGNWFTAMIPDREIS